MIVELLDDEWSRLLDEVEVAFFKKTPWSWEEQHKVLAAFDDPPPDFGICLMEQIRKDYGHYEKDS